MTTHAPHPTDDEHALCGKYNTRNDPITPRAEDVDCLACTMHLVAGTQWEPK